MRLLGLLAMIFALVAAPLAAQEPAQVPPEIQKLVDSYTPITGKVGIPEAKASLDLGEDYLFYGADDAKSILTNLWGNPPETVDDVLGLVMPAGTTPLSDSWGAVISYEDTGYVSDDDAADTDYSELLEQLQEATSNANPQRKEMGYPEMQLVGWAETPDYDAGTHSVVWAQNLHVNGAPVNTLNYDLRSLGRYGVLSMNLISGMPDLEGVRVAARNFATHASFDQGARYSDFDSATDKTAEYGIAGLVAAGVGAAAVKKLGIFAILLKFLKPILIGIAVFFGAFWRKVTGLFGRGSDEYDEDRYAMGSSEPAPAYDDPNDDDYPPAPPPSGFGRKGLD